jgi:hypothetical protein
LVLRVLRVLRVLQVQQVVLLRQPMESQLVSQVLQRHHQDRCHQVIPRCRLSYLTQEV